ncbi:hypothetical protein ACFCX4_27050 [Kitasatospora sp. NPDC056327]|uniref:hypothetical protein n=1 Tax=Kitasatospora sp. NPDC056327 TaxID=3345785 RepID=UPI0035DB1A8F
MKKIRKAVTALAMTAGIVLTSAVATAGTAQAYPSPGFTCINGVGTDPVFGGSFLCNYGIGKPQHHDFPDGSTQVFGIGTDRNVWTRLRTPNGTLSGWVSLGGGPFQTGVSIVAADGYYLKLSAGTLSPARQYYIERSVLGIFGSWH